MVKGSKRFMLLPYLYFFFSISVLSTFNYSFVVVTNHFLFQLQERFEEVTDSKFPSVSEVRPSYSHLCFHTFMTFFVMFILEPHCVSNLLRWYYIPGLFFTKIGNVAHFWFWILTSRMVVKVSKEFHKHFHMV